LNALLQLIVSRRSGLRQRQGRSFAFVNLVVIPKSKVRAAGPRDHCAKNPLSKIFGAVVTSDAASADWNRVCGGATTAPNYLRFWRSGRPVDWTAPAENSEPTRLTV
jgi:hypothetical protein